MKYAAIPNTPPASAGDLPAPSFDGESFETADGRRLARALAGAQSVDGDV